MVEGNTEGPAKKSKVPLILVLIVVGFFGGALVLEVIGEALGWFPEDTEQDFTVYAHNWYDDRSFDFYIKYDGLTICEGSLGTGFADDIQQCDFTLPLDGRTGYNVTMGAHTPGTTWTVTHDCGYISADEMEPTFSIIFRPEGLECRNADGPVGQ